jgi:hypothetical protein
MTPMRRDWRRFRLAFKRQRSYGRAIDIKCPGGPERPVVYPLHGWKTRDAWIGIAILAQEMHPFG